jgi:hypothetical protein
MMHHLDPMMVPLMLAIAGSTLVARQLEPRSIYTARIHIGGRWALRDRPALPEVFADLASQKLDLISAAAPYAIVLRQLLHSEMLARPLYVRD